jgi:hypothetical protein
MSTAPFCLTETDMLYLYGKTLRLLAAEHDCFVVFDNDGTPVLDSEFYLVSKNGIERVE